MTHYSGPLTRWLRAVLLGCHWGRTCECWVRWRLSMVCCYSASARHSFSQRYRRTGRYLLAHLEVTRNNEGSLTTQLATNQNVRFEKSPNKGCMKIIAGIRVRGVNYQLPNGNCRNE